MEVKRGLTYDDVLLVPKKSPLDSRSQAILTTKLTRNISLNMPMVSLCMATVTESDMAIAMAKEGGLGLIHRFMSIEDQTSEVKTVKRASWEVVHDPITIHEKALLKDAVEINKLHGVTGLLVVNDSNKLVGILTARDFVFERDLNLKITTLMTPREKMIVADKRISLDEAKNLLYKYKIEKLPLIDENNVVTGLITIKDLTDIVNYSNACRDEKGRLRVGAAIGIKGDYLERAIALEKEGVDVLVVDVAHCHSEIALRAIRELRKAVKVDILAGNVATAEGAEDVILAGADGVKVGIGNGTICTTRIVAGAGVPQLTAISDAVKMGRKYNVPIVNCGGITTPGNFAKAIAAGASAVMFGSVLSGTSESPGPVIYKNGKMYKQYHGSTSYLANVMNKERTSKEKVDKFLKDVFVEGVESLVPFKGPVKDVIHSFLKGLRSGMSYCGARNIEEMHRNAEFVEITGAGFKESQSHDVELV